MHPPSPPHTHTTIIAVTTNPPHAQPQPQPQLQSHLTSRPPSPPQHVDVSDIWWLHRDEEDTSFPLFDHRRNWRQTIVVEVDDTRFAVLDPPKHSILNSGGSRTEGGSRRGPERKKRPVGLAKFQGVAAGVMATNKLVKARKRLSLMEKAKVTAAGVGDSDEEGHLEPESPLPKGLQAAQRRLDAIEHAAGGAGLDFLVGNGSFKNKKKGLEGLGHSHDRIHNHGLLGHSVHNHHYNHVHPHLRGMGTVAVMKQKAAKVKAKIQAQQAAREGGSSGSGKVHPAGGLMGLVEMSSKSEAAGELSSNTFKEAVPPPLKVTGGMGLASAAAAMKESPTVPKKEEKVKGDLTMTSVSSGSLLELERRDGDGGGSGGDGGDGDGTGATAPQSRSKSVNYSSSGLQAYQDEQDEYNDAPSTRDPVAAGSLSQADANITDSTTMVGSAHTHSDAAAAAAAAAAATEGQQSLASASQGAPSIMLESDASEFAKPHSTPVSQGKPMGADSEHTPTTPVPDTSVGSSTTTAIDSPAKPIDKRRKTMVKGGLDVLDTLLIANRKEMRKSLLSPIGSPTTRKSVYNGANQKKSLLSSSGSGKKGYGGLVLTDPTTSFDKSSKRRGAAGLLSLAPSLAASLAASSDGGTDNLAIPIKWINFESHEMSSVELLATARKDLRCIDWKNVSLELMTRQPPKAFRDAMARSKGKGGKDGNGFKAAKSHNVMAKRFGDQGVATTDPYSLSRPVKEGEVVDFFMSHSWYDDENLKMEKLHHLAENFHRKHGRYPTFWLDKVCIDQSNIGDGLKVLPINVMACKKMLVLCGPSYPSRLWCAWELCTLLSFMRQEHALQRVTLCPLDGFGSDVLADLEKFNLSDAKCYDPNEETRLRKVISAVGEERFNVRIRALAKSCRTRIVPPGMSNPFQRIGTKATFSKSASNLLPAPAKEVGVGLTRMLSTLNTSNSFAQVTPGPANAAAIDAEKDSGGSSRIDEEKGAAEEAAAM